MNQLNKLSGIAHWLPRLSLAAIFIYHGFPKVAMAGDVAAMMGMPVFMVLMLGAVEIGGDYYCFGEDLALNGRPELQELCLR